MAWTRLETLHSQLYSPPGEPATHLDAAGCFYTFLLLSLIITIICHLVHKLCLSLKNLFYLIVTVYACEIWCLNVDCATYRKWILLNTSNHRFYVSLSSFFSWHLQALAITGLSGSIHTYVGCILYMLVQTWGYYCLPWEFSFNISADNSRDWSEVRCDKLSNGGVGRKSSLKRDERKLNYRPQRIKRGRLSCLR